MPSRFRRLILTAFFLGAAAWPAIPLQSAFALSAIGLSPSEVYLSGKPGTSAGQEIVISNDGNSAFLYSCYFNDLWHDGEKSSVQELGTFKEHQAGTWLNCSPNRKLVPAGNAEKANLVAAIPKDAAGDYFALLYAEMRPPEEAMQEGGGTTTLNMSGRIGVMVVVTALGTEKPQAEILAPQLKAQKKFNVFQANMKNTGNVHLSGKGTLLLTDAQDRMVAKVDINIPFLFPGQVKPITATLIDPVAPGSYKAVLTLASSTQGPSLIKEFSVGFGR